MATAAVDGRFDAVIDQLQPKQRCAIKIDPRTPKHADLAAADRGEQNRRFWTVPRNGRESAVGSRNFQFSQRPFERVAVCQSSKSPKAKTQAADVASGARNALVMARQLFVMGRQASVWDLMPSAERGGAPNRCPTGKIGRNCERSRMLP